MEEFLTLDNLLIILGIVATAITTGLGIQWKYYKQRTENLKTKHESVIENLQITHKNECLELKQQKNSEFETLKKSLMEEQKLKQVENDEPLIQELKMVYVKYLHIRKESEPPVYKKFIKRLNETFDIHSEYHYYRFNKYNKRNNNITLRDVSSGIVDQKILHPWKKLTFTDKPSMFQKGEISQIVDDSDDYFSATTYYNGFKIKNEDIYSKMEMDTKCARLVADFSSIVGLEKLFRAEPEAFKIELDGTETKLIGLEKLDTGVYHIESYNLKKGETLKLDFHVNWNYLNE